MSEPALYKRKTKSGHILPGVTLEELKVMLASGRGLQPDEFIQAVGTRTFVSDEKWLPASDYPELAEHFPAVSGRQIIVTEVRKTKAVRLYAAGALMFCLLAAGLFWWKPYHDAEDARGNLGRVKGELESARKSSADQAAELKAMYDGAIKRQAKLEESLAVERKKLSVATEKLKRAEESVRNLRETGASASADVAELRSTVATLNERLIEAEVTPKFWPGADVLRAPEDAAQVRVVSMIPDRGYIYVVGKLSYNKGAILLLRQSGLFGTRVHVRVVNTYDHGQGERGLSLQTPDLDDLSAKKITAFGYGEVLDVSLVSTGR
jgi:hypothetical protein